MALLNPQNDSFYLIILCFNHTLPMKLRSLLFLSLAIMAFSCSETKKDTGKLSKVFEFSPYISDMSPSVISGTSDIRIVLTEPVDDWKKDMELNSSLLTISPKVPGKVMALSNRTIAFVPEKPLEQHTEYTFSLKLGEIRDVDNKYAFFNFRVKTMEQLFNVVTENLQSYDRDWQYIRGVIRTSDVMDMETAAQLLKADQDGAALTLNFDKDMASSREFPFTIDSIQRFVEDSKVALTWSGKAFGIDTEGDAMVPIPGKNNFTVVQVETTMTPQQMIEVNFSDLLKKEQNFDGLAVIEGVQGLRYTVNGNVLKIFPQQELKGNSKLEVFQGVQSAEGYYLKRPYSQNVTFEQAKPLATLLQSGTVLPGSKNLKINFETVNLRAVDVWVYKIYSNNILQFLQNNELNGNYNLRMVARPMAKKTIDLTESGSSLSRPHAFSLDLAEIIDPDPGAIYRIELDYRKSYSLYVCEGTTTESDELEDTVDFDSEEEDFSFWDNSYNNYYYDYDWRQRENPCSNSYYRNKRVGTNLLASNLGVVVKKGLNNSYFVAVNDLLTTAPIANAKVDFFNLQQQLLGSKTTDAEGKVIYDADNKAYFAIARKGRNTTYIKLAEGNALSMSKFDVSGAKLKKGLKGFLYGERGVWRPGDTLFLSFMLNDKGSPLPKDHPIKFELSDPYGKITHREVQTKNTSNFYSFAVATRPEAPTGSWLAKVKVGGATFSSTLKIETIKPNRLNIKVGFDEEVIYSGSPVKGNLEVQWLHGAVAKNLKVDINARFSPQRTSFSKFPGYIFDDPARDFSTEEFTVFDGKIDDSGKADFVLKPSLERKSPGMLKASFITKAYEPGGDFSTDVFSSTYSPYENYVGINVPVGDKRGMLLTDEFHTFEVVTVNERGEAVSLENLEVEVYKVSWRWWWNTSRENLSRYVGSSQHIPYKTLKVNTEVNGKGSFTLKIRENDWGRYLVRVKDPKGGHATGKTLYFDWPGWAGRSMKDDPDAVTMLVFSSDKENYNVGETATVSFPSSAGGRALVTIENGSEVLDALWVTPKEGQTQFRLPMKALYAPNIYLNIILLQPHAFTENDLPIRMYGTVPLLVEDPSTRLIPQITMPEVLLPEESFKLQVKEEKGRSMTYSVAVVDEGLLDLTRFRTPNPWDTFFAREALGVRTWDIYDDVIGAFGGRVDQVFSIGGDDAAAGSKNRKANRFKPMVRYLGPFALKAGATETHTIKMPKYIGSVRTMVVASNTEKGAYGSTEKTTPVRKPLMILASLPRKITPGEKVTLPVTVFVMEDKVKNVTVTVRPHESFVVDGSPNQRLMFDGPDEKMLYFDLNIADFKGIGKVIVTAEGNGEKASYKVEIDVLNPNPITTEFVDVILDPNSTRTIKASTFGTVGTNAAQLELSTLPQMDFNGRLQYLVRYPHGCVEQTTSAAFPQLFLTDVFDLTTEKQNDVQQNVEAAIQRIAHFQRPHGGFSYWPGGNNASDWGTTYAGHFLLEAEKRGFVLPIAFKENWIRYQKQAARQWRRRDYRGYYDDLAQAYRLYTLALAGSPDLSSMNRMRETRGVLNEAKIRLAACYALVGQKEAAEEILNSTTFDFPTRTYYYGYGSIDRNRAMALETLVVMDDKAKAFDLAKKLAENLSSRRWMSTQTTAYCLLAMSKFAKLSGGKGMQLQYTVNGGADIGVDTPKTSASRTVVPIDGENTVTLTNNKDNTVFVRLLTSGVLPVGTEKEIAKNFRTSIVFKNRDGTAADEGSLSQGTDFVAEVSISNLTGDKIEDVALTQIIPSGWEIVNTRFTDFGSFAENKADHIDIRDDRINFYFDLRAQESRTFRMLLNASYLGEYYLPGVQAEGMYDHDYFVRTKGKWIEVVK